MRIHVCMCFVSVIVKHSVLLPCAIDGRSRNPLYYYYYYIKPFVSDRKSRRKGQARCQRGAWHQPANTARPSACQAPTDLQTLVMSAPEYPSSLLATSARSTLGSSSTSRRLMSSKTLRPSSGTNHMVCFSLNEPA